MKKTYQSICLQAPIDHVWNAVNNFHNFDYAPDVISKCEIVGGKSGAEVGAKRILNEAFHETLLEHNKENYTIRYSLDDGPSPVSKDDVQNYVGCIKLTPVTTDDSTFLEWSSSWESNSDEAVEFCHNIYMALFGALVENINKKS